MKRLLLAGAGALALAGCGSGGTAAPVGANSADSTPVTAEGNVVSTDTSPVSTSPVSTPDATSSPSTPAPPSLDSTGDTTDGNAPVIQ